MSPDTAAEAGQSEKGGHDLLSSNPSGLSSHSVFWEVGASDLRDLREWRL